MGLLAQIVGNFTRVVEFPFDKNELCPGAVAILVNMELITRAETAAGSWKMKTVMLT